MNFNIDSFQPIDYRTWILGDECRKGANLKRLNLLTPNEVRLVNASSKYQDCRNDPGHGDFSSYYSLRLLQYFPESNRSIVFPATWVHDMGFFGVDPEEWRRQAAEAIARGDPKSLDDEAKRRPHQNRGCLLAGRLFQEVGYPSQKYHFEVADIIGDHDTRKLPTTVNGALMRICDLLWRVSYPVIQLCYPTETPEETLRIMEATCLVSEKAHLGEIGLAAGRLELANGFVHKFGGDAVSKVLEQKYGSELERMISFYRA